MNPGSINAYLDCAPRISSLEAGAGPSWVRTIIGYMMAHLHQPLSIALLSQVAGLSTSHFSTLFKRATGYSPIDFFIRAKMSFARELLSGTTLQVKEIAGMLGYDDPLYFSRRFKKVNGSAPKCFRTRSIRSFSPSER